MSKPEKINEYHIGELVRSSVVVTNDDKEAEDTTLGVWYRMKDGSVTNKNYPADPEIVKDSTGHYHIDLLAEEAGLRHVYWKGTSVKSATERKYIIKESNVV